MCDRASAYLAHEMILLVRGNANASNKEYIYEKHITRQGNKVYFTRS